MNYTLQIMSDEIKSKYLIKKKKQILNKYLFLSMGYLMLSIILSLILYLGTDGEMLFYAIILLIISGVCSVIRVVYFRRRETESLINAFSGTVQYAKIRTEFDCEIKFESINGELIVKSFSSEKYAHYIEEQQVYVMYVSEASKWYMDKEEMI